MSYTRLTAKSSLGDPAPDGSPLQSEANDLVAKYLHSPAPSVFPSGNVDSASARRPVQRLQTDPVSDHRQFDRQTQSVSNSIAQLRADEQVAQASRTVPQETSSPLLSRALSSPDRDRLISIARGKDTPRLVGPDPVRVFEENEVLRRELAFKQREMQGFESSYSESVDVFRQQAQQEKTDNMNLMSNVQKLRAQLSVMEEAKNELEMERMRAVSRQEETCNRKILHMRKSILMTEQAYGSLRSENDTLALRASEADLAKEECEGLRRQLMLANQNLTVLAQQNEGLQRELRRKDQDTNADLDVYVKQLDMITSQAAMVKKENERLVLQSRNQDKLLQEIEQLKAQNQELQVAINNLDLEATEQQERHIQSLADKDEECAREVVNFRRQIINLEKQAEQLAMQNAALVDKHRPQKITDEINGLTETVRKLADENARHEQQNEALQRAFQRKEEETQRIKMDYGKLEEEIRAKLAAAVNEHRQASVAADRAQSDLAYVRRQLEDAATDKQTRENETREALRGLQARIDAECHRANAAVNELESVKAQMTTEREKTRAELEQLKQTHHEDLRRSVGRKDEQINDTLQQQERTLELTNKLLSAARIDNAALANEVTRLTKEARQKELLQAELEAARNMLAQIQETNRHDLDTYNRQVEQLVAENEDLQRAIEDTKAQMQAEAQQRAEYLEKEVEALREKVIQNTVENGRLQQRHEEETMQLKRTVAEMQVEAARAQEARLFQTVAASKSSTLAPVQQPYVQPPSLGRLLTTPQQQQQFQDPMISPTAQSQQQALMTSPESFRLVHVPSQAQIPTAINAVPAEPLPDPRFSQSAQARTGSPGVIMRLDSDSVASAQAYQQPRSPQQQQQQATLSPVAQQQSMYAQSAESPSRRLTEQALQESRIASFVQQARDKQVGGRAIAYGTAPSNNMRFETVPLLFEQAALVGDSMTAMRVEKRRGDSYEWEDITWKQHYTRSHGFAKALLADEIAPYKGVVICAQNSGEWVTAFCGSMLAGALPVACHPQWTSRQALRILIDSEAQIVLVDSNKSLQRFLSLKDQAPMLRHIVIYKEGVPPSLKSLHGDFLLTWEMFMARANHSSDAAVTNRIESIAAETAACCVYTSGTVSEPKGVLLSHDNLQYVAYHVDSALMPTPGPVSTVSISSLCEAQGIVLDIIMPMIAVASKRSPFVVHFPRSSVSVANTLRFAKPNLLSCTLPSLFEIVEELRAPKATENDEKLSTFAKTVAAEASNNRQNHLDTAPPKGLQMAQQVLERLRSTVGLEKCTNILVVGAPVPKVVSDQLAQQGIDVLEAYGLAETTGFATLSTPRVYRFGTVGVKFPGTDLRVESAEVVDRGRDAQMLVRGRNVMIGYLSQPELTQKAVDQVGWFSTGDNGRILDDGCVQVSGRIKELFSNVAGDKVSPFVIEDGLRKLCPALSNVIAVGERRKYAVALVTLRCRRNPDTGLPTDELEGDARAVNPEVTTVTAARRDEKWLKYVANIVSQYNATAPSSAYKVRRFCILAGDVTGEELTPTGKPRRSLIIDRCANIVEKLYADESPRR
jgi:long-chain-fatty-acid--CoA ligase ACSBG